MKKSFILLFILSMFYSVNHYAQSEDLLLYLDEAKTQLNTEHSKIFNNHKKEKALSSYKIIKFNKIDQLQEKTLSKLTLPNLPDILLKVDKKNGKNKEKWSLNGKLNNEKGTIFLSSTDGYVNGVIQYEKNLFWIKPIKKDLHILMEIDPAKLPLDEPEDWDPEIGGDEKQDSNSIDSKINGLSKIQSTVNIDVLVAYTPAVAAHSGNITSLVNACIQSANDGLNNSNMSSNVNLNLVGKVQLSYTESNDVLIDKNRLVASNDGYMDNIFSLRNQYYADIVVLLVDNDSYGHAGIAAEIESSSNYAYCVVVDNYAVGYYTFAHEIGHLIGARHDNDPTSYPRPYAHGYRYNSGYWRTIMAVYDENVLRVNYWSSPNNTYGGVLMGTTNWNDNKRVWLERANTVSNFRTYVPLIANINGSTSIYHPFKGSPRKTYTWTASVSGKSPFTYKWYWEGYQVSTTNSYSKTLGYAGIRSPLTRTLKLVVTDSSPIPQTVTKTKTITEYFEELLPKKAFEVSYTEIPTETKLLSNYPNPFNPSTTIKYQLSEPGFVSLKVYDMLGREVANLVNEQKGVGFYETKFDASNLTSGIYFYTIRINDYSASKKMLLTK